MLSIATLSNQQYDSTFPSSIQIRKPATIFTSSAAENLESQLLEFGFRIVDVIHHKTKVIYSFSLFSQKIFIKTLPLAWLDQLNLDGAYLNYFDFFAAIRNPKGSKECWDPAYLFASRKFLASKYPTRHFCQREKGQKDKKSKAFTTDRLF
jgi:hypothetical protein